MRETTMEPRNCRARSVATLAALVLCAGCASIAAPGPDMVPVSSRPDGARVELDGVPVGRTPCTVAFSRAGEGVLRISQDGYEPMVIDRDKVLNGWFVGNLLWGTAVVIAAPIDLLGHNQGKYSTDPIYVELQPVVVSTPH